MKNNIYTFIYENQKNINKITYQNDFSMPQLGVGVFQDGLYTYIKFFIKSIAY